MIACFSDPGLHAAREATARPVLGIAECGLLTALTQGERFGIVAILADLAAAPSALRAPARAARPGSPASCRSASAWSSSRTQARTFERMVEVGGRLRDEHGADVLVLGCAGMAQYRSALADALGMPVVDPTQAAVTMAIGAVLTGSRGRRLMRLDGKKALITGAGSYGIGRAIALGFAREGADVAIHYHSRPEVAAAVVARDRGAGPARRSRSRPISARPRSAGSWCAMRPSGSAGSTSSSPPRRRSIASRSSRSPMPNGTT